MERKIFFYGAGAIGCFYAAMLSRHSDVTLIARKKYIKLKSGVILHGKINKKIKLKVAGSELIKKLPNNSIIFITTKAHSNHEVSKQLKKIIGKGCIIVCLQNGLHVERPFERHIRKRATILRAVTNTALTKVSENKVQVNWIGSVLFPNDKEGRIVHAIFKKSWKNSEISKNIERAIWEKLAVNAVINPLTAITKRRNEIVLKMKPLSELIVDECIAVAKAEGVKLSKEHIMWRLSDPAPANYSSMLQDIMHHKRTEIEFINGKIAELAKKHKIKVPMNSILTKMVKGIENIYL